MARNTNYKMLQIPTEAHDLLKQYCKKNGYKMGHFVAKLISKECKIINSSRVLRVED